MKIAYVAKHGNGGNDEEGAIRHALSVLGHDVSCIDERTFPGAFSVPDADFLLCHHLREPELLKGVSVPKVFWCFDLIDFPDQTLAGRCRQRMAWADAMTVHCDLGFMTDGDWVEKRPGKLRWLPQAADERVIGQYQTEQTMPILMTCIANGGRGRRSFVEDMIKIHGTDVAWFVGGKHGEELKKLIGKSRIVIAPDSPVTDRYWSNRVYLTLGFGGFLLHPYCARLYQHYDDRADLVYYRSRAELYELIRHYLDPAQDGERRRIAAHGLATTKERHTYHHRCSYLVDTVSKELGIG